MFPVMFESIARRYDLANTVLSLGLHHRWKRSLVEALRIGAGDLVLDVGTGTGDLAHLAASRGARVIGIDISAAMLGIAARRREHTGQQVTLIRGDLASLPLADRTANAVMSAFVLRHLPDLTQAFAELRRVLVPTGRIELLELGQPREWIRPLYDVYSFRVIPLLGGYLTGDRGAYEFLIRSIRSFPAPAHVAHAMQDAGFVAVRWRPVTGGIATLFTATASGPFL